MPPFEGSLLEPAGALLLAWHADDYLHRRYNTAGYHNAKLITTFAAMPPAGDPGHALTIYGHRTHIHHHHPLYLRQAAGLHAGVQAVVAVGVCDVLVTGVCAAGRCMALLRLCLHMSSRWTWPLSLECTLHCGGKQCEHAHIC